jgi:LPXTG-motif cell wall-anchored protein
VDRNTLLWALVLFFGASVMFSLIRNVTEDQSVGVSLGAQAAAGLLLIGAIVLFLRRRR